MPNPCDLEPISLTGSDRFDSWCSFRYWVTRLALVDQQILASFNHALVRGQQILAFTNGSIDKYICCPDTLANPERLQNYFLPRSKRLLRFSRLTVQD